MASTSTESVTRIGLGNVLVTRGLGRERFDGNGLHLGPFLRVEHRLVAGGTLNVAATLAARLGVNPRVRATSVSSGQRPVAGCQFTPPVASSSPHRHHRRWAGCRLNARVHFDSCSLSGSRPTRGSPTGSRRRGQADDREAFPTSGRGEAVVKGDGGQRRRSPLRRDEGRRQLQGIGGPKWVRGEAARRPHERRRQARPRAS